MNDAIVLVRDVVHAFGDREVLHGVDLEVRTGELLGIVGPNGAGKTTLLRLMQGLLRPTSGSATMYGTDAWPPSRWRNRRIGVHLQDPALFEQLTVSEQLHLFAKLRGDDPANVDVVISELRLADCQSVRQEKLSGGQRQRLSVACALVGAPELVFLDEPTANVDPVARQHMRSVLRKMCSEGTAMVYTSHDINEVGDICDRVIVMFAGRIIASGTPEELKKRSGLTTLEIHGVRTGCIERMDSAEIVSTTIDEDPIVLISRDSAATIRNVRSVDPDAHITTRTEPFEDLYIRLITQAKDEMKSL